MNIEQRTKELIEEFKRSMREAANDVLDSAYCEILPHAEFDTQMNVHFRTEAIVKNILGGRFLNTTQNNTVLVSDDNGIDIAVTMTSEEYDAIRTNLISAMPSCPKDLEIESLKKKIKLLEGSITHYKF